MKMIKIEKRNFMIYQFLIFILLQNFNFEILSMTESRKPENVEKLITSTSIVVPDPKSKVTPDNSKVLPVQTDKLVTTSVPTPVIASHPEPIKQEVPITPSAPVAAPVEIKSELVEKPVVELKTPEKVDIETSRVHTKAENKDKKENKEIEKHLPEIEIRPGKILVDFTFFNEDLATIISKVAKARDMNIILPLAPNNIVQKVSFGMKGKITIDQAWDYLLSILELSGYSVTKNQNGIYTIVKNNQNVSRENMPLYINVPPDKLPYTDQRIRYVYYLSNMRVPEMSQGPEPLNMLLKEILTVNGFFMYDPKSNAVIIIDTAKNIASVAEAVIKMDNIGYKEGFEFVQLLYTSANNIVKLLKELIPQTQDSRYPAMRGNAKTDASFYFSPGTKIVAAERENRVIIIGKDTAISRIRDFITQELDVAPESGKSILHSYDLQYLDAESFAKDLAKIVASGGGVSDQTTRETAGGPERFFEGVIVLAETYKEVKQAVAVAGAKAGEVQAGQTSGLVYQGGNRLIVAARESDWLRIQELIRKLDKPQPQVILEVLVLDITKLTNDSLAGSIRNKSGLFEKPLTGPDAGPNFLSSNIANINDTLGVTPPPTTLAADLLRYLTEASSINVPQGSFIMSFNDPNGSGIWGLLTILKANTNTKVLSHPFLVTTNNKTAFVESVDIKRQAGESDGQKASGAITIKQEDIPAKIRVDLVPRISSLDRLNLKINVYIEDFTDPTNPSNFSRTTRTISTNANLGSGQVLALGGLLRTVENHDETGTPLLSKIPVIGWLFKSVTVNLAKSNLVVFISPTIVEPKLRMGVTRYTGDKIKQVTKQVDEKDEPEEFVEPIQHLFFGDTRVGEYAVEKYLEDSKNTNIKIEDVITKKSKKVRNKNNISNQNNLKNNTRVIIDNSGEKAKVVKDLIAFQGNPFLGVKERKS